MRTALILGALLVARAAGALTAPPGSAFYEPFDYADGRISASHPVWFVTSGALYARQGLGWTDSPVFRVITRRRDFRDCAVSFRLRNRGLTIGAGQTWHGAHVFLRYQSQYHLYAVTVNRRDGTIVIKKKVPGGSSNGGTYYTLASARRATPYGAWQFVRASAVDLAGGAVRIDLSLDGGRVMSAVDHGAGGPPIRAAGAVGIRSDYDAISFDDFRVDAPGAADAPFAAPPPGGGSPGAPEDGAAAKAPQRFLSPAAADGVNDAAVFGGDAAEVSVYDAAGREVFAAKGPAGGLRWDAKDRSGRLVDSGVYVVRITTRAGRTFYQSIAVVK